MISHNLSKNVYIFNYLIILGTVILTLSGCGVIQQEKNALAIRNNEIGTPKDILLSQMAEPINGFRCRTVGTVASDNNEILEGCSVILELVISTTHNDTVFFYKGRYVGYGDVRYFPNLFSKKIAEEKANQERIKHPSASPATPSPTPKQSQGEYVIYTGTGWLCKNGYIVTNYHVIDGQVETSVRFNSIGQKTFLAKVVVADKNNDLAILQLENKGDIKSRGIPISSKLPRIGEDVFTIGYPKSNIMGKNPKVTNGIISALSGLEDDPRVIQTTVAIQSGNSGGPLLNMHGEVVGVTTATLRPFVTNNSIDIPQNVNYAIKSVYVLALLSSLPEYKNIPMITQVNSKLEDMIPKIQDSIVQIIVKHSN